jgi:hypothetical protein
MSALEYELEGEEFLGPLSASLLRQVGVRAARTGLAQGMRTLQDSEFEFEAELEGEFEGEAFVNPLRRVYPDAMMEHFGHAAAAAESEAEAEAFVGAVVPLALRLIPRVAPAVARAAPGLVRGVAGVTRVLRANPATRQLVRTVPTIVRRTVVDLNRQAAQGRPLPPQQAVRTFARQAQRVLCSPPQARSALRRNAVVDRRYHRVADTCRGCIAE